MSDHADINAQITSIFKLIETLQSSETNNSKTISELKTKVAKLEEKLNNFPDLIKAQNDLQTSDLKLLITTQAKIQKDEYDEHRIQDGKEFKKQTLAIVFGVVSAVLVAMVLITLKLK